MEKHAHKCRGCGRIWEHVQARDVTDRQYEKLHTCTCGKIEYYVYDEFYRFLVEVLGIPEPPESESRITDEEEVDV
jgi:hypothetical protein